MIVRRDFYLQQLVDSMWDGQVKVITGLRRCGKSYLLKNLFGEYLRKNGVSEDQIIIDFVVNKGGKKVYVQSVYRMDDEEKRKAELKPFALSGDNFRKIVVRDDIGHRFFDDSGVLNISLVEFLQDSTGAI